MKKIKLGTSTVPCGRKGKWQISEFTLSREDVMLANLRHLRDGNGYLVCPPGRYKRLTHDDRGVVMSNTPMEIATNKDAYEQATGRVLINGLGMGMLLEAILSKPDVTYVRVIEIDADVIALVGPHFANNPRVEIVHADALTYKPAKGEVFDYAWHDIWDSISSDNLPEMATLGRRYNKRVSTSGQGFWARKQIRQQERRWG